MPSRDRNKAEPKVANQNRNEKPNKQHNFCLNERQRLDLAISTSKLIPEFDDSLPSITYAFHRTPANQ
eukprot:scaffold5887_cov122-Cylindrotheca_fusiformis.AAC.15